LYTFVRRITEPYFVGFELHKSNSITPFLCPFRKLAPPPAVAFEPFYYPERHYHIAKIILKGPTN
jgi:hypothetical protein